MEKITSQNSDNQENQSANRTLWERFNQWDLTLSQRVQLGSEKTPLWYFTAGMAHSGDSWYWLGGLLLIWLLNQGEWHNRAAMITIGIFFEIIMVFAIKFLVRRARPQGEWGSFYRITDPHSFPSGHAARAGLVATMAVCLGPIWFSVSAVIWAPMLALSRAAMGVHYFFDVVAGMLLGSLIALVVIHFTPLWQNLLPFLFL